LGGVETEWAPASINRERTMKCASKNPPGPGGGGRGRWIKEEATGLSVATKGCLVGVARGR